MDALNGQILANYHTWENSVMFWIIVAAIPNVVRIAENMHKQKTERY